MHKTGSKLYTLQKRKYVVEFARKHPRSHLNNAFLAAREAYLPERVKQPSGSTLNGYAASLAFLSWAYPTNERIISMMTNMK